MEKLVSVLGQLGVDSSIYYQLVVSVVLFFLLKYVLFEKLKSVILLREEKTTGLSEDADAIFAKADQLANDYHRQLTEANKKAQMEFTNKKLEIVKRYQALIKKADDEAAEEYTQQVKKLEAEYEEVRKKVLLEAEALAGHLVRKLT